MNECHTKFVWGMSNCRSIGEEKQKRGDGACFGRQGLITAATLTLLVIGCLGIGGYSFSSSTLGSIAIGLGGGSFALSMFGGNFKNRKWSLSIEGTCAIASIVLGILGMTGVISVLELSYGLGAVVLTRHLLSILCWRRCTEEGKKFRNDVIDGAANRLNQALQAKGKSDIPTITQLYVDRAKGNSFC